MGIYNNSVNDFVAKTAKVNNSSIIISITSQTHETIYCIDWQLFVSFPFRAIDRKEIRIRHCKQYGKISDELNGLIEPKTERDRERVRERKRVEREVKRQGAMWEKNRREQRKEMKVVKKIKAKSLQASHIHTWNLLNGTNYRSYSCYFTFSNIFLWGPGLCNHDHFWEIIYLFEPNSFTFPQTVYSVRCTNNTYFLSIVYVEM